jgi:hypothetical protein
MDDGFGGWVWLVAGLLYLLADFAVFDWGVSWYTVLFVVLGLHALRGKK